jgi:hypothetical protein
MNRLWTCALGAFAVAVSSQAALAKDYFVATTGDDAGPGSEASPWRTIQKACDSLEPGDTATVKAGVYKEKLEVRRSGSAAGFVTIRAEGAVTLSGQGVPGSDMIRLRDRSYVRIEGFEIRDNRNVSDGSGIRVTGSGDHIELRRNRIHEIRGHDAMGITVYGTSAAASISNLVIDGNEIFDCDPAQSEALTLNGNVEAFEVTNNKVHDVNNIGIDFIGGESIVSDKTKVARNGVCRGNEVWRARSNYGGGYGAGIYVDGGRDIVIERNLVHECDLGIEVGAENPGVVTRGIVVRDNVLYANDKVGLVFGGYDADRGRVKGCRFTNNTFYKNDTKQDGNGEIWVQYAEDNVLANNLIFCGSQNLVYQAGVGSKNNTSDWNVFYLEAGAGSARFAWRGTERTGLASHVSGSGQDKNSLFASPRFANAVGRDFKLAPGSPAIDRGDPAYAAAAEETDFAGAPRIAGGRIDVGAYESSSVAPAQPAQPAQPGSAGVGSDPPPATATPNVPSPTPGIVGALGAKHPTLRRGATGADVKALQKALSGAGFALDEDGDFGARTLDAVKRFQRQNGLDDDGVVGPKTWRALEGR